MQDGRNERDRPGATSALDDVRARSAERFGRKGEPGADAENAEAAGDRAADRPVEAGQSPPVTSEPSDDQAEDSLELIESEDSDETPDSAST